MTGIYIHIPFCAKKCSYCDFYSISFDEAAADDYAAALCCAIKSSVQTFTTEQPGGGRIPADTIYFGGGTPSIFGSHRISRVLSCAREYFDITENAEITIEANPASCTPEDLQTLRESGINRISFGVQSLSDTELRALGRLHNADDACRAIEDARKAGFRNISADLMLGVPGQTIESLRYSIEALSALTISHISAYILKIEENTPFAKKNIFSTCPGEDECADIYLECVKQLERKSFAQYEISNFAKEGFKSRHNLKYWHCEPYLGFGPCAHSFYDGRRFHFPPDLSAFTDAADYYAVQTQDGPGGGFDEYAMLRLRLTEGLDLAKAKEFYPAANTAELLARAQKLPGLTQADAQTIRLTPKGFLVSNSIIARLLA